MIRRLAIVREAADRVAAAAIRTTQALRENRIEQEPAFTDRMLGAIEERMENFLSKGIRWQAKTFTDRGRNAQEKRVGADFAGVLSISLPGLSVNKGFLAQAKLIEPGARFSNSEYARLRDQSDLMLQRTPDAFVFLYSKKGISIVPAISVVSSDPRNPHEFYSRSISRFYEEHFESFIGDGRISALTMDVLDKLRAEFDARTMLYLGARRD